MYRAIPSSLLLVLAAAACEPQEPVATEFPSPEVQHSVHAAAAPLSASELQQLAQLRRTTARFQRFEEAEAAGYSAQITPCWAHSTLGAMGYHYGMPDLIDGQVNLLEPELLMYEPQKNGRMKLVGMEYIVPIDAWEGSEPPTLLGQVMHQHPSLPIYKLHIWLWENNPRGMFADWNPRVSCQYAAETEIFD